MLVDKTDFKSCFMKKCPNVEYFLELFKGSIVLTTVIITYGCPVREIRSYPIDKRPNLNVDKTFKRRPGSQIRVLCTSSLCGVTLGM